MTDLAMPAPGEPISPEYARERLAELRAEYEARDLDLDRAFREGLHVYLTEVRVHAKFRNFSPPARLYMEVQLLDEVIAREHDRVPGEPLALDLGGLAIVAPDNGARGSVDQS